MSRLASLHQEYAQSIWLNTLNRDLLQNGGLRALVAEGVRGVNSGFADMIDGLHNSHDYDDSIRDLMQADHKVDDVTLYKWLLIQDAQDTADILQPVYHNSDYRDGYVCVDISPYVVYDTESMMEAARSLWRAVDRPNVMIKIPATSDGLRSVEFLIAEGINVNVTSVFSVSRFKAVADAYLRGLLLCPKPAQLASVVSFPMQSVDRKVDSLLKELIYKDTRELEGRTALANAKLIYRHYLSMLNSGLFKAQVQRGGRPQRPLWTDLDRGQGEALTQTYYADMLIAPDNITAMSPAILDVFQTRGELSPELERGWEQANRHFEYLYAVGIHFDELTFTLEQESVKNSVRVYQSMLRALKNKRIQVSENYASSQ